MADDAGAGLGRSRLPAAAGPARPRPPAGRPAWSWRASSLDEEYARPRDRPGDASGRRCSRCTTGSRRRATRGDASSCRGRACFGTPPWAVARQLAAITERVVRPASSPGPARARVRPDRRGDGLRADRRPCSSAAGGCRATSSSSSGVVDGSLRFYEPAHGRLVDVSRAAFAKAQAGPGRVGPAVVHRGAGLTHPDPLRRAPWPSASSNSSALMAPESRRDLARAISSAGEDRSAATERM